MQDNIYGGIPSSIMDSNEWKDLVLKEYDIGSEKLLEEIIDKRLWSNAEIIWVLRRLVYFYGKKDSLLKKTPPDRLLTNMVDILRALFLLYDTFDPDLDDNLRSYLCAKFTDATWGITDRTRMYLEKFETDLD